jgi:hypothetical protein
VHREEDINDKELDKKEVMKKREKERKREENSIKRSGSTLVSCMYEEHKF